MNADARIELQTLRDDFFAAWSKARWQQLAPGLSSAARLISSQHGEGEGSAGFERLLSGDLPGLTWMRTSNHAIVVGTTGQAACSAYVIGLFDDGRRQFLFGASVVLQCRYEAAAGRWLLVHARLNVNWCKGDAALVPHWRLPPTDAGWQLGDPEPVIVSELDSPWALIGSGLPAGSIDDAVTELYSKYSWAIDQGDIAQLADCYTEDAAGGFNPIGPLTGRHAIIGQLKNFRRHWPWMQHFADVVRVAPEADGKHARAIVARIIPERPVDDAGRTLYGAHYQLRVRQEDDGLWRICWSDYRPGWFTAADAPAFDIGVTQPQQKGR
jgi:ketosteroid isomerase-like protein